MSEENGNGVETIRSWRVSQDRFQGWAKAKIEGLHDTFKSHTEQDMLMLERIDKRLERIDRKITHIKIKSAYVGGGVAVLISICMFLLEKYMGGNLGI